MPGPIELTSSTPPAPVLTIARTHGVPQGATPAGELQAPESPAAHLRNALTMLRVGGFSLGPNAVGYPLVTVAALSDRLARALEALES
jgi:hypothetical protein